MCTGSELRPSHPAQRQRAPAGAQPALVSERTILLVEDDDELRRLLAHALRVGGYDVVAVEDGDRALDWLGLCLFDGSLQRVPAAIVTDIRLPHFSGLELLEGMLGAALDVPVVLITGFPSGETYAEAFELGAARVLAKPFELEALLAAVRSVVGSAWCRRRPEPMDETSPIG